MKQSHRRIDALLRAANPAPDATLRPEERARAAAQLQRILSSPTAVPMGLARPRRASRPLLAAVVVVLAVLPVAGGLLVLAGQQDDDARVYASTPTPVVPLEPTGRPARETLTELASAAARQPDRSGGPVRYAKTATWDLVTVVGNPTQSRSFIEPALRESWTEPSGDVTLVERRGRLPDEDHADAASVAALPGSAETTRRFQSLPPSMLPADPADLRLQLGQGDAMASDAELFAAVLDQLETQPVRLPSELATTYQFLAGLEGVWDLGPVIDRGGRHGVAVAAESTRAGLPTLHILVVDHDTGRPLATEKVLTKESGALNVRLPAVIGYALFLEAGWVPTAGARP